VVDEIGGTYSTHGGMINSYDILAGEYQWKGQRGRNSIVVDWIQLAEDRNQWQAVVNIVVNTCYLLLTS
jgi:hypothetical protein